MPKKVKVPDERFIYQCRRCGGLDVSTECGGGHGRIYLVNASLGVQGLSMHGTHACHDGGHGISDLIGCEPIIKERDYGKA